MGTVGGSMNSGEGLKKEDEGSEQDHRETSDGLNVNPSGSTSAGRCWGWIASSRGRTTGGGGTHSLGFESVEGVSSGGSVDREHHSAGTMATLSTVDPNWSRVVHTNGESGEGGGISTNGLAGRKT